jgi:branched-chain amino acid aminotransferase|tara:strand:+ start:977 stop:1822 length:846 start_codon:yes stop_codon:yes gene_type:complete
MVNFNGNLMQKGEASVGTDNRGLNYGDAVFETLRVSGSKIFFWEDHYFRLMSSMRILRMEIPVNFTLEFLEDEVLKIVNTFIEKNGTYNVKILVWRKAGGKYGPNTSEIDYLITGSKIDAPFYMLNDSTYEVELFKDHYITSGLLSTLKSNNKIVNVLGSIYAKENDYQNCLLLNESKMIVEALNGNLFLVNGNKIKTPPLIDGCLNGILRKQIIAICKQLPDYSLEEASITPFELQKADEMFITNVITGIQPISKYRKKEYSSTVAKNFLTKINMRARLT